jgi:arylsulfotransferase ASST
MTEFPARSELIFANPHLTRRQLLRGAGAITGLAAVAGGLAGVLEAASDSREIPSFPNRATGTVRAFLSRPDLAPPTVTASLPVSLPAVGRPVGGDYPGLVFLGPGPVSLKGQQQYGPLIVDSDGEPVWFAPVAPGLKVSNFTATQYHGEPVLIWWEGKVQWTGYGQGEAVILDSSYRELGRVRAANGRSMDLHGLYLTPEGTALFTCYPNIVEADLSAVGGPRRGQLLESVIQEVDVATGRLLFEWRSLPHVPIERSYFMLQKHRPFDYLHVNSVTPTPDGNLLVSGRHAWALYKVERRTGRVLWTLGGKRSDFRMGDGAQFTWQHDARQVSDQLMTVFDNGSDGYTNTEHQSRGLLLGVDESRRTVAVQHAYTGPKELATSMGSVQVVPGGRVVVGWGTASQTTAFESNGSPLFNLALPKGMFSYRGLWLPWKSTPKHPPAFAAGRDERSGAKLVYASWNGATEVAGWQVDGGVTADVLRTVGVASRRGFETIIPLHPSLKVASITPVDRSGAALSQSRMMRL